MAEFKDFIASKIEAASYSAVGKAIVNSISLKEGEKQFIEHAKTFNFKLTLS